MARQHTASRWHPTAEGVLTERDYSQKDRDKMDDSDFGDPENQAFPIKVADDVVHAASRLHNAKGDQSAIKARIKRIAKRKGFPLPQTWQDEEKKSGSATTETTAPVHVPAFTPKPRIARIKSYFLEDSAISLNGRQYPTSSVDKLLQSAQVQLSDSNSLPLTCYLSHDHADRDSTLDIAGKITAVGREGSKAYAYIDIPDTTTGREVATLVAGGYIRSQSLRASGAEMLVSREHAFPQVGGNNLKLEGIDFTSSPGLPQVARIADLVLENDQTEAVKPIEKVTEVFNAHPTTMLLEVEQEEEHMDTVKEDGLTSVYSGGDTVGTDGSQTLDDYAKANYRIPKPAGTDVAPATAPEVLDAHDRIAYVIGMSCAPDTLEAVKRFGNDIVMERVQVQEAGAKLSGSSKNHLMKAHDGIAKSLGMECAPGASNDGMQDGDDDDKKESVQATVKRLVREALKDIPAQKAVEQKPVEQSKPVVVKEKKQMTPEEAAKLLSEAGYKIEAPKSADQLAQEALEVRLAEQQKVIDSKLEEMEALMAQQSIANPQRTSLVEGATTGTNHVAQANQRRLSYIQENMRATNPEDIIDRSRPLPEWLQGEGAIERALGEYGKVLLGLSDKLYPIAG